MSRKRKHSGSSSDSSAKKRRKAIDLKTKIKIIKDYEDGKNVQAITRSMGMTHSTISTIIKDKEWLKEAAKTLVGYNALLTRQRKGLVHEMEKLLSI